MVSLKPLTCGQYNKITDFPFHPVLAIRPVSASFSVVVILFHFIMLADKFYNNNKVKLLTKPVTGSGSNVHCAEW